MSDNLITIRVWGDFACFTRPEMKVERVSYPVMTPSAARGILEAIFWEPEIYYWIDSIHVIKRGRWFSCRRNEVEDVISVNNVKTWMKTPEKLKPIMAGGGVGTQRNMLALQAVEYLITAEVQRSDLGSRHSLKTYLAEIERRTKSGKCYHRPYLGVREFAADFDWTDDPQATLERRANELGTDWRSHNEDLGLILYDVFAPEARVKGFRWLPDGEHLAGSDIHPDRETRRKEAAPRSVGVLTRPEAIFFFADVRQARLDCHPSRARFAYHRVIG